MKILYLIPAIVCYMSNCFAQKNLYHPFAVEGKVWHMLYNQPESTDFYPQYEFSYYIEGDTLISGIKCKKLYTHNEGNNNSTKYKLALYEEGKTVYFIPQNHTDSYILYDFGIPVGTTSIIEDVIHPEWKIKIRNNEERYIIAGDDRRCLLVNRVDDTVNELSENYPSGWWIEGIGSELGPLNTWLFQAMGNCSFLKYCEINGHIVFNTSSMNESTRSHLPNHSPTISILYDLQGRRLHQKPAQGIYIDNGKKIAVSTK